MFVASIGKRIVGVCRVTRYPDQNQLRAICVHPKFQNQGIGSLLWNTSKLFMDLTHDVIVNVEKHNKNAIRFYKFQGFKALKLAIRKKAVKPCLSDIRKPLVPEIQLVYKARLQA